MEEFEGVIGGGEIVFVVRNKSAAVVGRDDFRREKMLSRKGALAGAGSADEDDERQIREREFFFHAVYFPLRKIAICVGEPRSEVFIADGHKRDIVEMLRSNAD